MLIRLRSRGEAPYCGVGMRYEHWVRFTWQLNATPTALSPTPRGYNITRASSADAEELRKAVARAFVLDPAWNAAIHHVIPMVNGWLDRAFQGAEAIVLALRHGTRIIGATAVLPDSESNLAPGPCVLLEYRSRGFGTHLLAHALAALREGGLPTASAIAQSGSPAARFLYRKFDGVAADHEVTPLKAA
jgi:GNAT superfamily N-acetyltransferase